MIQEIKPTYVTFEQAKWLKEKVFCVPCFYYYENGKLVEPYLENGSSTDVEFRVDLSDLLEHFNKWSERISAPEQHQVVEWLRVNHGIWVFSYPIHPFNSDEDNDYPKTVWISKIISTDYRFEEKFIDADNGLAINHHHSPQEAYSAAFDYIKNNNLI